MYSIGEIIMIETKWKDWSIVKLANNFTKYANRYLETKRDTDYGVTKIKYKFDVDTPNIITLRALYTTLVYRYCDDKSKVIGRKYLIFKKYAKKRYLTKDTYRSNTKILAKIFLKDKIIIYKDDSIRKGMEYVIKKLECKSGVNWRLIKEE